MINYFKSIFKKDREIGKIEMKNAILIMLSLVVFSCTTETQPVNQNVNLTVEKPSLYQTRMSGPVQTQENTIPVSKNYDTRAPERIFCFLSPIGDVSYWISEQGGRYFIVGSDGSSEELSEANAAAHCDHSGLRQLINELGEDLRAAAARCINPMDSSEFVTQGFGTYYHCTGVGEDQVCDPITSAEFLDKCIIWKL